MHRLFHSRLQSRRGALALAFAEARFALSIDPLGPQFDFADEADATHQSVARRVRFIERHACGDQLRLGRPRIRLRHLELPEELRDIGQRVLIGGRMGTESWLLVGTNEGMALFFGSACHGARW